MTVINFKKPISVTFYGEENPILYDRLIIKPYDYTPHNTGLILQDPTNNPSLDMVLTINTRMYRDLKTVAINANDNDIMKQILPELIKRNIITNKILDYVQSGFVKYPLYNLSDRVKIDFKLT